MEVYQEDEWDENAFPIASYLITIRTYGTWLHGEQRTSVQRNSPTGSRSRLILPNVPLEEWTREEMKRDPLLFSERQREAIDTAIREFCVRKSYSLYALNVRTNHAHIVVGAGVMPERLADSLKAAATKYLREIGLAASDQKLWSRGRSRRYLWKERQVSAAIDYVLYSQGDLPFEIE